MPGTDIRQRLNRIVDEYHGELRVDYSVTQHETVVAMVAANLGVALLPTVSIGSNKGIAIVSIKPKISREVGVVTRKGDLLGAAVAEFLKYVEDTILGRQSSSATPFRRYLRAILPLRW